MYLFIHPDGSVKAVEKREDLKGHYKFAGYVGVGVEIGTGFSLEEFKPKAPANAHPVAHSSADVKAVLEENAALRAELRAAIDALKSSKPVDPKPST
jgi:hypothetical protein